VSGSVIGVEQTVVRQKCSMRQVNMTISLAFLAPDLVRGAVEGRLPRLELNDCAMLRQNGRQFEALGLSLLARLRRGTQCPNTGFMWLASTAILSGLFILTAPT
jgi:hypothetical protein